MKRAPLWLGVIAILAIPAAAADAPKLGLTKGWKTEDGPYPPPWARQLPWRGDLQIRFPPGWFNAQSPYFWSYPVLYWLEGDVLASREDLEKALRACDGGLYRGGFDPAKIKIDVGEDRKEETRGHPLVRRSVTIDGFDPFTTRKELTTHLEIFRWFCPDTKRTAVLILRSPHPFKDDDPVWKDLLPFRESFSCHETPAPRPPEGFEAVFNGRDLAGWEGSPNYWSVEDGCLTGTADGTLKFNRFIVWRGGTLKNFELRVQVKVTPGGNSGLQYRGTERPDLGESVVTGYQCDVVANRPDYNGMLYEERGRRILAHTGERVIIDPEGQPWVVGEFPLEAHPAGQWHEFRVLAEGNHYRHWIDGQPTVDVTDLDAKGRKLEGVLAVQVHVGPPMKIQYRDVFLKRLPDDLPILTADQAKIPPDARKVVPQGKDKPRVPKMNVVLILADDLGWADVGCEGADLHETPHIDRLAALGVRFTQAYAASVCSPTRASLMTGKHPARLGITIWREAAESPPPNRNRKLTPPPTVADLPLEEVTIAEVLRPAGYLTALVGKWHLGDAAHYPETQGFDVNIGGTIWGAPQTFFYPYRGSGTFGNEYRYVPHLEQGKPGEYLTDRLTDEALRLIDAAAASQRPFFLEIAHHAPHTPIEAKPELVSYYEKKRTASPGLHHQNPAYAAMIHSLDENVGRVLNRLDERGLAEETVVIFTSDNGGYINEFNKKRVTDNFPLRSGKGSLYEGGIRVPLIVRWPGVTPRGAVSTEPVAVMDLYPTLRENLAPAEGPRADALDSLSLTPLLRDPSAHLARDALFFHYPHYYATTSPVGAIRAGDWKLLEYFEDNHVELYDLKDDPAESKDLAGSHSEKAEELRRRLHAWRKSVGARMPVPNPAFPPPRGR